MPRVSWSHEQAAIDLFVAAVHALKVPLITRAGSVLVRERFKEHFNGGVAIDDGTLLRADEMPDDPGDALVGLEILEVHMSAQRLEELEEGQDLTSKELALWRRIAGEAILTENPDHDEYQSWSVEKVTHSDRREAFMAVLGGGYSFTQPSREYFCGTRTLDEALAALNSEGFISVEDFMSALASGSLMGRPSACCPFVAHSRVKTPTVAVSLNRALVLRGTKVTCLFVMTLNSRSGCRGFH